jgi:hypothetical protein
MVEFVVQMEAASQIQETQLLKLANTANPALF